MAELIAWEQRYKKWKQRVGPSLRSGRLSDCVFQVGTEPNLISLPAHKLVLAAASPVFESMFYGELAEKNDNVHIPDIQPDAFKALLEYIYTDEAKINTFDLACELYYGANKYMLPKLVEECSKYLTSKMEVQNACRAYEFALLFDDKALSSKCLTFIASHTLPVLNDSSFEETEFNTVLNILSCDYLNITSELDLFKAIERYSKAHKEQLLGNSIKTDVTNDEPPAASDNKAINGAGDGTFENKTKSPYDLCKAAEENQLSSGSSNDDCKKTEGVMEITVADALKKIRFLTMTAKQFAEGPAQSPLLTKSQIFAVLMNIVSTELSVPMPNEWSTCRQPRNGSRFQR